MEDEMKLNRLSGLGQKRIEKLKEIGITNMADLLTHFPTRYEWIETSLEKYHENPKNSFQLEILIESVQQKPKYLLFSGFAEQIPIQIMFFHQSYRMRSIRPNQSYRFQGKIQKWKNKLQMVNPILAKEITDERVFLPVYRLPSGISQTMFRQWVRQSIEKESVFERDYSPFFGDQFGSHFEAIRTMHFPENPSNLEKARKRLAAEEAVQYQLAQMLTKQANRLGISHIDIEINQLTESLPFQLTDGQLKSISEIRTDMIAPQPMYRLLQGDVGSGKTVIAFLSMAISVLSGYQAAYLAPTEVLAHQVYEKAILFFEKASIPCALVTGSTKKKERAEIAERIKTGECLSVFGTHALLSDNLDFAHLSLVVTDEQHRFGVAQRSKLQSKGPAVDVLAMSATPIPRTLALTLFGEMSLSVIDSLPAGRKPIRTYLVGPQKREDAYGFLENEVEKGHRGFVVCPHIDLGDEPDDTDPMSIEKLEGEIQRALLSHTKHTTLHGRMKKDQQSRAMEAFKSGESPILLSTTIIEVGIDIPEATVIFIESAERFGLAQLHQLRGRVGRSDRQSYCILICHTKSEKAIERMRVLVESQDGFEIAEKDLKLRGQGNLFGLEQHGSFGFTHLDLAIDQEIWETVRQAISTMEEKRIQSFYTYARRHLDNLKEMRNCDASNNR
jgi:ATP-dependent DNA helicase RecG